MSFLADGDLDDLLQFPQHLEKMVFPSLRTRAHDSSNDEGKRFSTVPVDILETPKEYMFYVDVPGLSKTDIQVTVEDDNTLVIKNGGKRKREEGEEEEGVKYVRLERRASPKFVRKFRLPENANVSAISAKCENGVLSVSVKKLPPPPKPKTIEVAIS